MPKNNFGTIHNRQREDYILICEVADTDHYLFQIWDGDNSEEMEVFAEHVVDQDDEWYRVVIDLYDLLTQPKWVRPNGLGDWRVMSIEGDVYDEGEYIIEDDGWGDWYPALDRQKMLTPCNIAKRWTQVYNEHIEIHNSWLPSVILRPLGLFMATFTSSAYYMGITTNSEEWRTDELPLNLGCKWNDDEQYFDDYAPYGVSKLKKIKLFSPPEFGGLGEALFLVKDLDREKKYVSVAWLDRMNIGKVMTWELRDEHLDVETTTVDTGDGYAPRQIKKGTLTATLHLDHLTAFDVWYYSDILYSQDVRVNLRGERWHDEYDLKEDYASRVEILTNKLDLPFSALNDLTLDVEFKLGEIAPATMLNLFNDWL